MCQMAKRKDNFLRAGEIWMKIWTISGLTCLTVDDSTVVISKLKILYSVLMALLFCVMAYVRYVLHKIDYSRIITSYIQVYSGCSVMICSALMIILTLLSLKREAILLAKMIKLRDKYLLGFSRSILSFFPPSCIFPCIALVLESFPLAFVSVKLLLFTILSYCFSLYSFLFQGQIQYYSTMVEDGFKNLKDRLQVLERTAALDRRNNAVEELRSFRLMYHELFDHSRMVDELFCSRVILTVGHNFAIGVLFTYNAIIEFINPTRNTFGLPHSLVLSNWAMCCFFNLYVMVQFSERVRQEAMCIPVAVQSLSTRPGYKAAFYDEVLLRFFSSQFVLEDMQSTPYDFLLLNNRMLLSTIGAIASSLAILLQLTMTSN